ncbi:hypothetical protein DH2020_041656 [Rehmannia glutinosa]|uniref:Uncharacterized protein n=1 Tax=Rehmannia glutinosa TaxID=99300 RepID=A0ABR0URH3_REHGL
MASILPIPAMQDLKVTLHESILVLPSQETPKKSLFLSNIDQILNYNIPTIHFFTANPDFPSETVAKRLKMALEKVLVPYDFMAGRFKLNEQSGRLEIDCNAAGAGFVVASSEYWLDDLGDFVHPNLGFRQLAAQILDNLGPDDDQPLCTFQVTSFKCGGFAIGMSMNHALFDGVSAQTFIENLAAQAFDDKPLSVIPCHNRHLPAPDLRRIYNVLAALIWRCKALSFDDEDHNKEDRVSTLLNVVDIRSRLNPPLPSSYCGNAVLVAYASAKCQDLEKWPFSEVVKIVSEGPTRVSDEYVKSVIDWLEINKGLPCGEYMVTSWMRLRFDQVVYPWGKPVHSGPVVSHRKDICWVFQDSTDAGINALVSLPANDMERFQAYFRDFFPDA